MEDICSVEDCQKKVHCRRWCNAHYQKWRNYGDPLGGAPALPEICTIEDCENPCMARGWCTKHYQRWRRTGDPLETTRSVPILPRGSYPTSCTIGECGKKVAGRGLCDAHYYRWQVHGDPYYEPKIGTVVSCSVEGCTKGKPFVRGWCRMHYSRWRSNGDPLEVRNLKGVSEEERFWDKVDKRGEEECWEWTASLTRGYPNFHHSRGSYGHRYSYELHNNIEIKGACHVHHACGNPICVNPSHLQLVTPEENNAEMFERREFRRKIKVLEREVERLQLLLAVKE